MYTVDGAIDLVTVVVVEDCEGFTTFFFFLFFFLLSMTSQYMDSRSEPIYAPGAYRLAEEVGHGLSARL